MIKLLFCSYSEHILRFLINNSTLTNSMIFIINNVKKRSKYCKLFRPFFGNWDNFLTTNLLSIQILWKWLLFLGLRRVPPKKWKRLRRKPHFDFVGSHHQWKDDSLYFSSKCWMFQKGRNLLFGVSNTQCLILQHLEEFCIRIIYKLCK